MSFWWTVSWYTVWDGARWLKARQLNRDQAQEWHLDMLEAAGGGRQTLSNLPLWRWTGSTWERAA